MIKRLSHYSFDWKLSLFTLLLFPLLISLGIWQLSREQEKIALESVYSLRQSAPYVTLEELQRDADLQYTRVQVTGYFDNDHPFLLDNKVNSGRVGFELISPFYVNETEFVLINRGWLPQGQYRSDIPEIESILDEVTLTASIYVPLGKQVLLGDEIETSEWPKVIQSVDLALMQENLLSPMANLVLPYTLRLEPNMAGVLVRNWPVISTTPEKHRGYAVQWFTMAFVLIGLYLYRSTKPDQDED